MKYVFISVCVLCAGCAHLNEQFQPPAGSLSLRDQPAPGWTAVLTPADGDVSIALVPDGLTRRQAIALFRAERRGDWLVKQDYPAPGWIMEFYDHNGDGSYDSAEAIVVPEEFRVRTLRTKTALTSAQP